MWWRKSSPPGRVTHDAIASTRSPITPPPASATTGSAVDRAGDLCRGKPCWKTIGGDPPDGRGYTFRDRDTTSDGIKTLLLKGGDEGKSKVVIRGNGANLPSGVTAALVSTTDVRLHLRLDGSSCLATTLGDVRTQHADRFRAT
jgi:hypothetical protein